MSATRGPWRERRGFDSIVQTVSGMAYAQSGESKPRLMPVSAIDYVSGYLMANGLALGVFKERVYAFFCCRRLIRPSMPEERVMFSNSAR